jgi:hypothetical protein
MESRMKIIVRYLMPEEAEIARLALDDEGIASYMEGAATVGMFWHLENAVGGVKLLVAETDAERATAILAKKLSSSAEGGFDGDVCPQCGAKLPPNFCVCWSCGATLDDGETSDAPPQPSSAATAIPTASADQDEDDYARSTIGDAMAWRAFAAAIIGLVFLPGLLHLYSIWTLLKLGFQDHPLSRKGSRCYYAAMCIDVIVCTTVGWFLRWLYMQ